MTLVVDASFIVASLVDSGPDGEWADSLLRSEVLAAPHLLPAEVTNVLRRTARAGLISDDTSALAFADLGELPLELFPFDPLASRIWELRNAVTTYDAWYVALAEELRAPLATLDRKLARAQGPRCPFRVRDLDT